MADRTLFVGPCQQPLEDEAFAWARANAQEGIGRVLYLSADGNTHDQALDRWRTTHEQLTLRTETLTSFVYDCYEQIEGPSAQLPDELDRRALEFSLDDIVTDRLWLSSQAHASANLVDAFKRRFARFENVGLNTPARVRGEFEDSNLPDRIRDTTVEAYEAYYELREERSEPWHVTYSQAFETVADADLTDLMPHVDVVILSGFLQFGDVEQAVVEALVDTFPTAAILPTFSRSRTDGVDVATEDIRAVYSDLDFKPEPVEPADSSQPLQQVARGLYRNRPPDERTVPEELHWRELPTPEREVRYVAREIRTQLDNGATPAEIGVVIPGFHAYEGYIEDVFDTYELPYSVETGGALTETFVGSAVMNLVSLAEVQPRAAELTELVTNPVVELFDSDGEDEVVSAERRVDSVRVDAVQRQLPADIASRVQTLLDQLAHLRDQPFEVAIETFREQLAQLQLGETIEESSRIDTAKERAALKVVQAVLDSFEETELPISDLSPAAALLRAFEGATLSQYSGGTDQIAVSDHLDAKGLAFDELYIVGLTADYFPSITRHPAFFERMVDEHPILELVDDRVRDRYVFSTLLGNADAVTLTTPSTDPDSTAVVRSPILDELSRVTGIEPTTGVDDRIGSREDLQRAISPLAERRAAVDAAGERGDFTPEATIRIDRGTQCAAERKEPDISPHDGLLDPETVAAVYPKDDREPYSASRIERYVNCSFQFYMEHVVGLEDDDDIERTPDPLETGTFVHDTFERFYAELQSEPGEEVDLQAYEQSELEAHMLAVALDELESAAFDYSGLFYRRWLEQLFAGLATPEQNPYYGNPRPHQGVERGLFARFVEREYDRNGDALPAWFEAPFGEGLRDESGIEAFEIDLPNGESVAFRGYIDRVDIGIDEDNATIQLFDYKTGYAPSMTKTTGGTTFQLPIYLLAAEEVLAADIEDVSTLSATYYQTKPPNKLKEPKGIESKFDSHDELRRFLDETVPERLETLTTAIEHGRFHTTLLSEREAGCEYCAYQRSCDVRHHQRRERVEQLDTDPQTYVPVRATPRSFENEFGGEADD